jgi:ABC transporter substrate binding protein
MASLPRGDPMKRREFITLLGGVAAAWPLAARAQQPTKLPTIGFLGAATPSVASHWLATFVQRLRELGWIEGRNIVIEPRWAEGRRERSGEIAAEFVRLKVDIIVTWATEPAVATKQATSVIPIVFALATDPSRQRPGSEFGASRRQRLRQLVAVAEAGPVEHRAIRNRSLPIIEPVSPSGTDIESYRAETGFRKAPNGAPIGA